MLVEVCFKGNRKEFFLWEGEHPPALRSPVIVEADRGEDLGHVHAIGDLAERRARGTSHGPGDTPVTQTIRRPAGPEDLKRLRDLREQDEAARRKAAERVKANGLAMKLSDAEWRWDRRKLTIYFTAEKRVDFRNLVRELATTFRTRIELKQIGVRDEARRLSGIGRCGREYCSASWLPELRPVNLGVAKDQRLSLNPSQISGACGRLMCCLRYEHEFYVQQRKRFPKEGKTIATAKGQEKVMANDIFRERVTLRGEDGEVRVVPLPELRLEMGVFPEGAEAIPNPFNRMPGFSIRGHWFLPGFPQMAHPMVEWVLDTKYREHFDRDRWAEGSILVFEAGESQLIPVMQSVGTGFPGVKVFSLPSMGADGSRRHVELGVRGDPGQVGAAMDAIRAGVRGAGFPFRDS